MLYDNNQSSSLSFPKAIVFFFFFFFFFFFLVITPLGLFPPSPKSGSYSFYSGSSYLDSSYLDYS